MKRSIIASEIEDNYLSTTCQNNNSVRGKLMSIADYGVDTDAVELCLISERECESSPLVFEEVYEKVANE